MERKLIQDALFFDVRPKMERRQIREGVTLSVITGPFQRADVENGNGRIYTSRLFENTFGRDVFRNRLERRLLLGMLGHPESGNLDIEKSAFTTTKVSMPDKDGWVYGEAEILTTPSGKVTESLYDCGVQLGISSRGYGPSSVREGIEYLEDDQYECDGWDLVVDPSVAGAYPSLRTESRAFKSACDLHQESLRQFLARIEGRLSSKGDKADEFLEELGIYKKLINEMNLLTRHSMVCNPNVTSTLTEAAHDVMRTIDNRVAILAAPPTRAEDCGCRHEVPVGVTTNLTRESEEMSEKTSDDKGAKLDIVERLTAQVESVRGELATMTARVEAAEKKATGSTELLEAANKRLIVQARRADAATKGLEAALAKCAKLIETRKVLARRLGASEKLLRESTAKSVKEYAERLSRHVARLADKFGESKQSASAILVRAKTFEEANSMFSNLAGALKVEGAKPVTKKARIEMPTVESTQKPMSREKAEGVKKNQVSEDMGARMAATLVRNVH